MVEIDGWCTHAQTVPRYYRIVHLRCDTCLLLALGNEPRVPLRIERLAHLQPALPLRGTVIACTIPKDTLSVTPWRGEGGGADGRTRREEGWNNQRHAPHMEQHGNSVDHTCLVLQVTQRHVWVFSCRRRSPADVASYLQRGNTHTSAARNTTGGAHCVSPVGVCT